jgi:hypothetical protein
MRVTLQTKLWLVASLLLAHNVKASISGHVVNMVTHEPIPNADVTLTCVEPVRRNSICKTSSTTTSDDGTFKVNLYDEGKYVLSADASGMAQTRDSSAEVIINFRKRLYDFSGDLKLAPESTIAGKVVDLEKNPRPGIEVIAWRQYTTGHFTRLRMASKAVSDDAGNYVLRKLAPGNYYVATALRKPGTPAPKRGQDVEGFLIYAPSAFSLSEAKVIHLDVGQSTDKIELGLRPFLTYHLEGRAQMESIGPTISGDLSLYLDPRDQNGVTAPGRELELHPGGKFEANLLPGLYTLRLVGITVPNTTAKAKEPQPMLLHLLAKQEIEISGKDAYGIMLLISPPYTIDGHVSVDGQPNETVKGGEVKLEAVDPIAPAGSVVGQIQADGNFSLSSADAVTYAIRCVPPAGMYVKSAELNGQDALAHYLELGSGVGGGLKILLRPGAASVSVSKAPESKATDVVLIPDVWIDSNLTPVVHLVSRGKAFTASGLTPGGYTAVATAGLDAQTYGQAWANDIFVQEMRSRGTTFSLGEGEQKVISPPEFNRDEIDGIEFRLGIY